MIIVSFGGIDCMLWIARAFIDTCAWYHNLVNISFQLCSVIKKEISVDGNEKLKNLPSKLIRRPKK